MSARTWTLAALACTFIASACAAEPHMMVVAANPLAAEAGLEVLRRGGSAADAAVAVQAALGLVEPQSSGLGGGGFILYYDAARREVIAYNGREIAPAGARPDMFLSEAGQPLSYEQAVLSGRATGVPGAVAALGLLQREHGRLPWSSLFTRAAALAREGFIVSPRLAGMIAGDFPQNGAPDVQRYFTKPDGTPYRAGDRLRNPAYARTLSTLAAHGSRALYTGRIAADIVARVHAAPRPGTLALADLAAYQPRRSAALCHPWESFTVCVPPPPAGGIDLLEGLLLLDHTDIAQRGPGDATAWVELAEAERLMYADRDRYVADPTRVAVPVEGLLDDSYIAERARLIGEQASAQPPAPGVPPGAEARGPDHTREPGGTSHFVIVDAGGNVVSMTTTVESIFGCGRMVDGFFLNNQLTDFSFVPTDAAQRPVANAVAAGKQPRSAMTPTIVLDRERHFVAATGSAGGPAIIAYVMKTLIATLAWQLPPERAVALPNLVARGARFSADVNLFEPALLAALDAHGVHVAPGSYEQSGLQAIVQRDGKLLGGADPRREGVVLAR